MKSRKDRSAQRRRALSESRAKVDKLRAERGEHGPADPMPDGSARKAGEDVISYLVATNRLGPEQEVAAREIEFIFMEITKGLWARGQDFERKDRSYLSADLSRHMDMEQRYNDFSAWCVENLPKTKRNYLKLVLDACVHGDGLRDFERRNSMKSGTGAAWISRALTQYAVCANWLTTAA